MKKLILVLNFFLLSILCKESIVLDEKFKHLNNWKYPKDAYNFFVSESGFITTKADSSDNLKTYQLYKDLQNPINNLNRTLTI